MVGAIVAAKDVDPFAVLKRIKEAVFRGRVRLHEFFSDFDPLRAGVVSTAKFRTALELERKGRASQIQARRCRSKLSNPLHRIFGRSRVAVALLSCIFARSYPPPPPHIHGSG